MRKKAVTDVLKSKLIDKIILCEGSDEQKKKVYALAIEYLQAITYNVEPKTVDKVVGVFAVMTRLMTFATRHNFTSAEWNENVLKPFFDDMKAKAYEALSQVHDTNRRDTAGQTEVL